MAKVNIDLGFTLDSGSTAKVNKSLKEMQKILNELHTNRSIKGTALNPDEVKAYKKELTKLYSELENYRAKTQFNVVNESSWKNVELAAGAVNKLSDSMTVNNRIAGITLQNQAKQNNMLNTTKKSITDNIDVSNQLYENFKRIGAWSISAMAFKQVTNQIQDAVNYAKELDQSLSAIRTVTGASFQESMRMGEQYNKMAKKLSTTTTEIANASVEYYRQGRSETEVNKLVEASRKASAVSGEGMENTTSMLTATLNGFQMVSSEVDGVIDKFSALDAASATSFKEMSYALTKVASSAHNAEISVDEMLGMIASVSSITREAPENIGTSFKTIFARMRGTTEEGFIDDSSIQILNDVDKALGKVGIKQREWSGELKGSYDVLDELGDKWAGLNKQTQSYLATEIAGSRQQSRFFAMMDNWDMVEESVRISETSMGKADEQFARYQEGLEAAINETQALKEQLNSSLVTPKSLIALNDTMQLLLQSLITITTYVKPLNIAIMMFGKVTGKALYEGVTKASESMLHFSNVYGKLSSETSGKGFSGNFVAGLGKISAALKKTGEDATTFQERVVAISESGLSPNSTTDITSAGRRIIDSMKEGTVDAPALRGGTKKINELQNLARDHSLTEKQQKMLTDKDKETYDELIESINQSKTSLVELLELETAREIMAERQAIASREAWSAASAEDVAKKKALEEEIAKERELIAVLNSKKQQNPDGLGESEEQDLIDAKERLADATARQAALEDAIQEAKGGQVDSDEEALRIKQDLIAKARALGIENLNETMTEREILELLEAQSEEIRGQLETERQLLRTRSQDVDTLRSNANKNARAMQVVEGVTTLATAGVAYAMERQNAETKYERETANNNLAGNVANVALPAIGAAIGSVVPVIGTAAGAAVGSIVGAAVGPVLQMFTEAERKELERLDGVVENFNNSMETHKKNFTVLKSFENFDQFSKSVSNLNENLGLTTEQYTEYISMNNQIAEMLPDLITGYDAEGNAILDKTLKLEDYLQKLKEQQQLQNAILVSDFDGIYDKIAEEREMVVEVRTKEIETKKEDAQKQIDKYEKKKDKSGNVGYYEPLIAAEKAKMQAADLSIRSVREEVEAMNAEANQALAALSKLVDGYAELSTEDTSLYDGIMSGFDIMSYAEDKDQAKSFQTLIAQNGVQNIETIASLKEELDTLNATYVNGSISTAKYEERFGILTSTLAKNLGITRDMVKQYPQLGSLILENESLVGKQSEKLEVLRKNLTQVYVQLGYTTAEINSFNQSIGELDYKGLLAFSSLINTANSLDASSAKYLVDSFNSLDANTIKALGEINFEPENNLDYVKMTSDLAKLKEQAKESLPEEEFNRLTNSINMTVGALNYAFDTDEIINFTDTLNNLYNTMKSNAQSLTSLVDVAFASKEDYSLEDTLSLLSREESLLGHIYEEEGRIKIQGEGLVEILSEQNDQYNNSVKALKEQGELTEKTARIGAYSMQILANSSKAGMTSTEQMMNSIASGSDALFAGMDKDAIEYIRSLDSLELESVLVPMSLEFAGESDIEVQRKAYEMKQKLEDAIEMNNGIEVLVKVSYIDTKINEVEDLLKDNEEKIKKKNLEIARAERAHWKSQRTSEKSLKKAEKNLEEIPEKLNRLYASEMLAQASYIWDKKLESLEKYNEALERNNILMNSINDYDYAAKGELFTDNLDSLTSKSSELKSLFDEYASYEPMNEEDAKAIAERISSIGQEIVSNNRAIIEANKQISDNEIANITGQTTFNETYLKDGDIVRNSNLRQLKKGFASGTGGQLALSYKPILSEESELDKRKRENEELLEEEKRYLDEIGKIKQDALDKAREYETAQYTKDYNEILEERADLQQQINDILQERNDLEEDYAEASALKTTDLTKLEDEKKRLEGELAVLNETKAKKAISSFYNVDTQEVDYSKLDELPDQVETFIKNNMDSFKTYVDETLKNGTYEYIDTSFISMLEEGLSNPSMNNILNEYFRQVAEGEDLANTISALDTITDYYNNLTSVGSLKEGISANKDSASLMMQEYLGQITNDGLDAAQDIAVENPVEIGVDGKYFTNSLFNALTQSINEFEGSGKNNVKLNIEYESSNYVKKGTVITGGMPGFASGTDYTPEGPILVGEYGKELAILPDGTQTILGQNGAEITNIPQGSKIYNARETRKILNYTGENINNRKLNKISKFAAGTTNNQNYQTYSQSQLLALLNSFLIQSKAYQLDNMEVISKLNKVLSLDFESYLKAMTEINCDCNSKGDSRTIDIEGNQDKIFKKIIDKDLEETEKPLELQTQPDVESIQNTSDMIVELYTSSEDALSEPIKLGVTPDNELILSTEEAHLTLYEKLVEITKKSANKMSEFVNNHFKFLSKSINTSLEEVNTYGSSLVTLMDTMSQVSAMSSSMLGGSYSGGGTYDYGSSNSANINGYNVDKELYNWIQKASNEAGIDPALLFAIVANESGFKSGQTGPDGTGTSYGYTQLYSKGALPGVISTLNSKGMNGQLAKGDTYENVLGGAYFFAEKMAAARKTLGPNATEEEVIMLAFTRYNGSGKAAEAYAGKAYKNYTGFQSSLKYYAKGVKNIAVDTDAIVGERGAELVKYPDGRTEIRGENGPEQIFLPKGSTVLTANETRKYLQEQGGKGNSSSIVSYSEEIGSSATGIADIALMYKDMVQYAWGKADIDGEKLADCSGYVSQCLNKVLPDGFSYHNTSMLAKEGESVAFEDIARNDVIMFKNTGDRKGISHTGIALGDGTFIHAANEQDDVIVSDLNSSYWKSHFADARRIAGAGSPVSGVGIGSDGLTYAERNALEQERLNSIDREVVLEKAFANTKALVQEYYGYEDGSEELKTMIANVNLANGLSPFLELTKNSKLKLPKYPKYINAYANGGRTEKSEYALYGEEGPELAIYPNGEQELLGQDGPEIGFIPKGTFIANNKDTKKILSANNSINAYASGTGSISTTSDKTVTSNTKAVNANTTALTGLENSLGETALSLNQQGMQQFNAIENAIHNDPNKAKFAGEWEVVKDMFEKMDSLAETLGLDNGIELLNSTFVDASGEIKSSLSALVDQDIINAVESYSTYIQTFLKNFGFSTNYLTTSIIDAGDKINEALQRYTVSPQEKVFRNAYNNRAEALNQEMKDIRGYDGASAGANQYLQMEMQMSEADFDRYIENKMTYGRLVGNKSRKEVYPNLSPEDQQLLYNAIQENQALRAQYSFAEDLMDSKAKQDGLAIIAANGGVNPLRGQEYIDKVIYDSNIESTKMQYFTYELQKQEALQAKKEAEASLEQLLASGTYTKAQYDKALQDVENASSEYDEAVESIMNLKKEKMVTEVLDKVAKELDKASKAMENYSNIRGQDTLGMMEYKQQFIEYSQMQMDVMEETIKAYTEERDKMEIGSSQYIAMTEDIEELTLQYDALTQSVTELNEEIISDSFTIFEQILKRVESRIESINKIDDIRDFMSTVDELQLQLDSINGTVDLSAIYNVADISNAQTELGGLTNNIVANEEAVLKISDLYNNVSNMSKETLEDREAIANYITQTVHNAYLNVEEIEKAQSALKDQLRAINKEYALQQKAFEELIEQKQEELDELEERNKKEEEYNNIIKLRMELLKAMDATEHRYITGQGTVEYRADMSKVNDIQAQLAEAEQQNANESASQALQDEIDALQKQQEEQAEYYELSIGLLEAQISAADTTMETIKSIYTLLDNKDDLIYGMTGEELQALEDTFRTSVLDFNSAVSVGGALNNMLNMFMSSSESALTLREGAFTSDLAKIVDQNKENNDAMLTDAQEITDKYVKHIDDMQTAFLDELKKFNETVIDELAEIHTAAFLGLQVDENGKAVANTTPSTSTNTSTTNNSSNNSTQTNTSTTPSYKTYTIQKGDTLTAIAKKYGVSVSDLMTANTNIKDKNKIYTGNTLRIPQFDTGGYTGNWGNEDGRLAILHQKELVLNAEDTSNLLKAVEMQRELDFDFSKTFSLFSNLISSIGTNNSPQTMRPIVIENINLPDVTEPVSFTNELSSFLSSLESSQG